MLQQKHTHEEMEPALADPSILSQGKVCTGREKTFTVLSGSMTLEQRETEVALSRLWLREPLLRLPCTPSLGCSYSFQHCCAN